MTDMYKAYLDDLGRIGGRHENARKFYISVMSTLFVLMSLSGKNTSLLKIQSPILGIVAVAGIAICIAWFAHMQSFRKLSGTKLEILRRLEDALDTNKGWLRLLRQISGRDKWICLGG